MIRFEEPSIPKLKTENELIIQERKTAGEFFGEEAALGVGKRSKTVVTKSKCEFLVLTIDTIRHLVNDNAIRQARLVEFL